MLRAAASARGAAHGRHQRLPRRLEHAAGLAAPASRRRANCCSSASSGGASHSCASRPYSSARCQFLAVVGGRKTQRGVAGWFISGMSVMRTSSGLRVQVDDAAVAAHLQPLGGLALEGGVAGQLADHVLDRAQRAEGLAAAHAVVTAPSRAAHAAPCAPCRRRPATGAAASVMASSGQVVAHSPHCTQFFSMKRSCGRSALSASAPCGQAPTQLRHIVQLLGVDQQAAEGRAGGRQRDVFAAAAAPAPAGGRSPGRAWRACRPARRSVPARATPLRRRRAQRGVERTRSRASRASISRKCAPP